MTSPTENNFNAATHGKRLLLFVVSSLVLANVVQWGLCRALHLGNPRTRKIEYADFMHMRQWTDSWFPMMKSLDDANPTKPIYAAPLYDTLIYSLASELPLVALRRLVVGDAAMLRLLALFSWLCVVGVAAVSLWMGRRLLLRMRGAELTWPWGRLRGSTGISQRWGWRRSRLRRWRGNITTGSYWGSSPGIGLLMGAGRARGRGCGGCLSFFALVF